jgi:CheY-like chemotaxis protein
MKRVRLVHWNETEAAGPVAQLQAAGFAVDCTPLRGPADLRVMAESPPDAVVIDLSRTPSHGRDIALAIRTRKGTRHLPLVFVEGDPGKVALVRALLPDAAYSTWRGIRAALRRAIAEAPTDPVVPASALAGYAGTPLPRKLGIRAGATLALVGAPPGFEAALGELPAGAVVTRGARTSPSLTLWFVRRRSEFERRIARLASLSDGLWVAWPKQASGTPTDLTQAVVREIGLAAGLVDFKICALDEKWSALRFSRRVEP